MPGRRNIVLTRASSNKEEEETLFSSPEEALNQFGRDDAVFIIGRTDLSRDSLHLVDTAWVTEIQVEIEEEVTFDALNNDKWHLVWREEHPATEAGPFAYKFQRFERVKHSIY